MRLTWNAKQIILISFVPSGLKELAHTFCSVIFVDFCWSNIRATNIRSMLLDSMSKGVCADCWEKTWRKRRIIQAQHHAQLFTCWCFVRTPWSHIGIWRVYFTPCFPTALFMFRTWTKTPTIATKAKKHTQKNTGCTPYLVQNNFVKWGCVTSLSLIVSLPEAEKCHI